jgi:5'-3' exonuclease/transcription antitermination factor NusG
MAQESQWVVLELTPKADGEDPDVIRASIRHHIRNAEVFVPASVVQRGVVREYQYLVEGYAFVRHEHPDSHYSRLEDTKFVQNPLYVTNGSRRDRKLATVGQMEIERMRSQIIIEVEQGIEVGDRVLITSGPFKAIQATVKEEILEQDSVVVHIKLRSTERLVTLPRAFMRLESKSPYLKFKERVESIRQWVKSARKVSEWDYMAIRSAMAHMKEYTRLSKWAKASTLVSHEIKALQIDPDFEVLRRKSTTLRLLSRATELLGVAKALESRVPDLAPVIAKYHETCRLVDACNRMREIYMDVQNLTSTRLNLIVDGTQLFIRCATAPGLGALMDSQGRCTGPVVGFLRSLGSYRKRFPEADIWVCWDGSSQRRKVMYEGYKGTRPSRSGAPAFGWEWLREALPLLGVKQVYNPEEEADDAMATLVWGKLKESINILVTSDRDLLQIVSDITYQLCPAVGAGQEKLYDPALVLSEYGVTPAAMVQLRSLCGDKSDNIPGVSNFGVKTASSTLKLYGSIDTLLDSNLAGMTRAQAQNIRAAEAQLRLNVELMTLRHIPLTEISIHPDQTEAEQRIKNLEIKPDSILQSFFLRGNQCPQVT